MSIPPGLSIILMANSKAETQIARFRQAARELETDDSEKSFNEKLGKIAKHDCGGLELASDSAHHLISALVAGARRKGFLICNGSAGGLI
jgi:hypothetical protein